MVEIQFPCHEEAKSYKSQFSNNGFVRSCQELEWMSIGQASAVVLHLSVPGGSSVVCTGDWRELLGISNVEQG